MCDAVQDESYEVDGVEVSSFVLPLYFTLEEQAGGRNDFLGRAHGGKKLRSFGINPGGYVGFFDPASGEHDTYSRKTDKVAARRIKLKRAAGSGRGNLRKESNPALLAALATSATRKNSRKK
jgi:hypothetical protein